MTVQLMHGDCLVRMAEIPDGSVDMILADLPYGTTNCKWDNVIPFEPLWKHYWRVLKPNGAVVLFGSQPFTSKLVMSCARRFRYSMVWDKVNKYTGSLNANRIPLKRHEDLLIFYRALPTYNKQFRNGRPYKTTQNTGHGSHYNDQSKPHTTVNDGRHNPCSIIPIAGDNKKELGHHPTQKPVALLEYLIKTYTHEGETVLDNTMGSGSTGVAAVNTSRKFIGIEQDDKYFAIAQKRIADAQVPKELWS